MKNPRIGFEIREISFSFFVKPVNMASFFPTHKWMLYIFCLFAVYLVVFGALLLLCAMDASGYFSVMVRREKY